MICRIVHGIDKLNSFISSLTMWLMIPLIGIILYEVVARYCFNAPTVWGTEMIMMTFGALVIFSGPVSIMDKVQVGVDIFSSRWSSRTRAIVSCLTFVFTAIFLFLLWKTSLIYALEAWEMKEVSPSAWGQPVYHWKALVPVAVGLMLLQSVAEFLRNAWLAVTGKEMP